MRLWYQAGWAGDLPLEATIAKRLSPREKQPSGKTRSIPDLAPMWWMRIRLVSAHGPPTRPWFAPKLLNDLGVVVVGFACSRVRHDLLQHLAAARPLGCSALGLLEYPLIQTSQIGGNRSGPACYFQSCPLGMSWVPAQAPSGPGAAGRRSRQPRKAAAGGCETADSVPGASLQPQRRTCALILVRTSLLTASRNEVISRLALHRRPA